MACDSNLVPVVVSGMPDGTYQLVEQPSDKTLCFNTLFGPLGDVGKVLTVGAGGEVVWSTNAADAAYDASGLFNDGEGLGSAKTFPAMAGNATKFLALSDDGATLVWQKPVFTYDTAKQEVVLGEGILGDGVVGLNLSGASGGVNFGGLSASGIRHVEASGEGVTYLSSLIVGDLDIHANAVVPSGIGATLHSDDQITCNADATLATHLVRWNQVSGNFTSSDHGTLQGLGDDDHTQYHNDTRGDARYYQKSEFNSDGGGEEGAAGSPIKMDDSGYIDGSFIQESDIDHGGLGGLGDDDHTQYHNDTRGDVRYNLKTDLASTVNSKGASLVGIEDAGAYTSVTDVEAAIQEIYPTIPTSTWSRYISYAEQPITWNGSTSYYSNPGVSNATNKQRATAGLNMTNSNERGHVFQIIVPPELDVTAVITATVYARTGAAGSGNIEIEWSGGAQTDNEYMGTGATTTGAVIKDVSSYGNNDSIQIALGTVWNADTLVEGDILHMTIFRDATVGNGDDTFAATLQYMGIELTGTRKAAF